MSSGGSFRRARLRLGPDAHALVASLESDRFRRAIATLFRLEIERAPTMLTVRGCTREKDGRIHRDSTAKLATILLYLNPEGESWARNEGRLRLLRGPDDLENYVVEVPPVNGTLLALSERSGHLARAPHLCRPPLRDPAELHGRQREGADRTPPPQAFCLLQALRVRVLTVGTT